MASRILSVDRGSPAWKAGLKPGQRLLRNQVPEILRRKAAGKETSL